MFGCHGLVHCLFSSAGRSINIERFSKNWSAYYLLRALLTTLEAGTAVAPPDNLVTAGVLTPAASLLQVHEARGLSPPASYTGSVAREGASAAVEDTQKEVAAPSQASALCKVGYGLGCGGKHQSAQCFCFCFHIYACLRYHPCAFM